MNAIEAIRTGNVAELRRLLERDAKLVRKPQLVVDAGRAAQLSALKVLHQHGADLNAIWRGYRALHSLIQEQPHAVAKPSRERVKCLEWLLEHGADPEQLGAWPPARAILIAAFVCSEPFVTALREHGALVDGFAACALGEVSLVKRTLAKQPGFATARDQGGLTALQCCAASRIGTSRTQLAIANLLLDAGADPNARTKSWSHDVNVTYFAIGAQHTAMLELLLDRGADPTDAVSAAAWQKTSEYLQVVAKHGAKWNEARADGRPVLNELIRWGQITPALWLLEHGADPNLADDRGWTAVHQAASRGNQRMFEALLAAGGDFERNDKAGLTPLDVADVKAKVKWLARLVSDSASSLGRKRQK